VTRITAAGEVATHSAPITSDWSSGIPKRLATQTTTPKVSKACAMPAASTQGLWRNQPGLIR
jgi:hypothetical protein